MTYFRLHTFCRFIYNDNQGCLYDLSSGNMWNIDEKYVKLLIKSEKNVPIERNSFFNMLYKECLGRYYDNPLWIDHSDFGADKMTFSIIETSPYLKTVYIVFNECSYNCAFCSPKLNRQTGCKKHNTKEQLKENELMKILEDALTFGCEEIVYIGGDPLLYKELLSSMVKNCYGKVKKQEVYTNGRILDNYWLNLFSVNEVKLNCQIINQPVFFDNHEEKCLKTLLDNVDRFGIKISCTVLANRENQDRIDQIIQIASRYNINCVVDTIISPEGHRPMNWKEILGKGDRFNALISPYTYSASNVQNSCLYGKIAIRLDGTIIPCPMMDNYIIENIKNVSLIDVLKNDKYRNMVYLTKNEEEKCGECVYRYGCKDCRAIEYNLTRKCRTNVLCCR